MPGATAYSSFPGGQDMGQGGYSEAPFGQNKGWYKLELYLKNVLLMLLTCTKLTFILRFRTWNGVFYTNVLMCNLT